MKDEISNSYFMVHSLSHHAYAIASRAGEILPRLCADLERAASIRAKSNPDFRLERYEMMGIGEAHALQDFAQRVAVAGGEKIFVVSARGITKEAQSALLKIFEEPPEHTHFFLIVPSLALLLPTLLSRLFIL